MPKSKAATQKTAYWSEGPVSYYFERSAQFVMKGKKMLRNGKVVAVGECSPCSCGIGGCGDGGGCDSY